MGRIGAGRKSLIREYPMAKHNHSHPLQSVTNRCASDERMRRIEVLGGFGAQRIRVKPDRTKYTRKDKHVNKGPQGPFYFTPILHVMATSGAIHPRCSLTIL